MKAMVCEHCGSNDIVKQDGNYVCQACETKYSVEEARKLMIEGTVDVSGSTVKVDDSQELANLYELARRAKESNNNEMAQKYYEQILLKDVNSWEANFYSIYYQAMNCKTDEIDDAANRLNHAADTTLDLIQKSIPNQDDQKNILDGIAKSLISLSVSLIEKATEGYTNTRNIENFASEKINYFTRGLAVIQLLMDFGDSVENRFGDSHALIASVPVWEIAISGINVLSAGESSKINSTFDNLIAQCSDRIKKYKPNYQAPAKISKKSGCYVATCVYGSYDCPEVWTLRRYRDNTLAETWYGRAFIRTYYAVSPTLVKWFGETKWFKNMWKPKLDRMVKKLQSEGVDNTPYNDRNW